MNKQGLRIPIGYGWALREYAAWKLREQMEEDYGHVTWDNVQSYIFHNLGDVKKVEFGEQVNLVRYSIGDYALIPDEDDVIADKYF